MKRFRYEWVTPGEVSAINRLLTFGWRPVREVPLVTAARGPDAPEIAASPGPQGGCMLVVLEREDESPSLQGQFVAEGVTLQFLGGVSLLDGLTESEMREFVASCERRMYDEGDLVFDQGSPGDRLYIIMEGSVSIHLLGLPIDDPVVLHAAPQEVFGESTFFSPGPHSTRAEAASVLRTLEFPREVFDEMFQAQRPAACKIAVNSASLLGDRLQATDQWVREILQEGNTSEIIRSWRRFRHGFSGLTGSEGGIVHA